jgi:HTH-type transcriptional regulator/antitoxin HigA
MNSAVSTMVREATKHWRYVAPVLNAPKTAQEFERLVAALDEVLDAGGADESNELAILAERMGDLVVAYENRHVPELDAADGVDVLRHLMKEHGLRQSDLPEVGSQSLVSQVLNRKRRLNAGQLRRLSRRFRLPMDVFAAD